MALFKKAVSTSAFLKAGLMGFAGAGKTRTASDIAIGLALMMQKRGLPQGKRPIFFLDTETGSDFIIERVKDAGLEISTSKTRAFVDLTAAVREAEKEASVLIIDSATHFWREFCESYQKKKNRSRLEFQDWATLKAEWGSFTDLYVNSACHIILCGRAGFEYDFFEGEDGKKELQKTGVKMKAEGEMGYEPSLLLLMEREINMKTKRTFRVAHVLKDRFGILDGKELCSEDTGGPTFEMFLPHIERLNLGGTHLGVDTSRTSEALFAHDGTTRWKHEQQQKAIALDEVKEEIQKMYPGQTAPDKAAKADALEQAFGTRSWAKVESMKLDQLKVGRDRIWEISRGHRYGEEPADPSDTGGWVTGDGAAAASTAQSTAQSTGIELALDPANNAAAEAAGK